MTKNKKSGFTMVEIIAVLVIIGIMTAVAAPKFISMGQEARNKAVFAGISEAKASLSVAYAKAYLENNGTQPTESEVMTASGLTAAGEDFGDITVKFEAVDGSDIKLTASGATGTKLEGAADQTETWELPSN